METTEKGKPRRVHHKTRKGCTQCKQRKVKCDEQKPICKRCDNHGTSCSFLSIHPRPPPIQSVYASPNTTTTLSSPRSSTPQPQHISTPIPTQPTAPSPSNFTMLDLEILHFYDKTGASSLIDFPSGAKLFETTVVQLAFEHPFLMHELLSLSALQLSILHQKDPTKSKIYAHASDSHFATGLSQFQPEIANLSERNCDPCFVFSTMMFLHAWAAQDISRPTTLFFAPDGLSFADRDLTLHTVQWVRLHFGTNTILRSIWPTLQKGRLTVLWQAWDGLDPNREHPLDPVEKEVLDDLPAAWHSQACDLTQDQVGHLDLTLRELRRVYSMLNPKFNQKISKLAVAISWFNPLSEEYIKMLERKEPEALLLVVYYCVCLKQLEHMWWMEGKGENLLRTVVDVLEKRGNKWERWTRWPIEQVIGRRDSNQ